jgi:hypothetical protein
MTSIDVFKLLTPDDLRMIADSLEAFNHAMVQNDEYTEAGKAVRFADVFHPATERFIGRFVDTGDCWYGFEPYGEIGRSER